MRRNCCSDPIKKLLKFEAIGREFEIFEITRTIYEQFVQTVKGQNNFW